MNINELFDKLLCNIYIYIRKKNVNIKKHKKRKENSYEKLYLVEIMCRIFIILQNRNY